MTAIYDKLGVRFMYPENWEIMDEDPQAEPRTIAGAFWSVTIYNSPVDESEIAASALAALREEYEELEEEPVRESIADIDAFGYDVEFYVQQLVAAARIRVFPCGGHKVLLLCQAEDREFERLDPVFRAMTLSYLQSSEPGAS